MTFIILRHSLLIDLVFSIQNDSNITIINHSMEKKLPFYSVIGQLFYAIAAADKTVKQEEIVQLKELIETDWLPLDDEARSIEVYFKEALDQMVEIDICIEY